MFMKINNEDNFNGGDNKPPKQNTLMEILIGLGASILILVLIFGTLFIGMPGIISIVELIIIACSTFLAVRCLRRERKIIGIFILATIIPMTLLLMLVGSCAALLGVQ